MLTCPHCGRRALGYARKLTLAPLKSRTCISCGALVSLSWWSVALIVALPIVSFIAGTLLYPGISFQRDLVFTGIGAAIALLVIAFLVPLVRRDT